MLHLGPAAGLAELAAALGGGVLAKGATAVVVDGGSDDPARAFLARAACDELRANGARSAWVCA